MPGYLTKQESIAIAGVNNLTIRSLQDNQQFADPLGLAEALGISAATWPLFGLLWPSGGELAAHMADHPLVQGQRFLEIGCGLGLASLVGHRRGGDMTASDCHPLAAEFMLENLRLNALPPMKYRHGHWGETSEGPHPSGPCAAVSGLFDVIMGSDVLYERDDGGGLAQFIQEHAAPIAEIWIVDPHRSNRPAFNRRMAGHGFELTELRLDRLASTTQTAYRGRLLTYSRHAA
jgi:predicted nicotinamide N-methyase